MRIEIWKDINGYENLYQASNFGRIKSLPKYVTLFHGGGYWTKEKILKPRLSEGYLFIALFKNKGRFDITLHRLIALTFKDNPLNKKEINHIDGDKLNNNDYNLEWNTHQENVQHGYDTGLYDGRAADVICIRKNNESKASCY